MPLALLALGEFIVDGIAWLLGTRLGFFIFSAMIWLGINFASVHVVIQPVLDQLHGYSEGGFGEGSIGEAALAWMKVLQFPKALSMVISAYITKYSVKSASLHLSKRISS